MKTLRQVRILGRSIIIVNIAVMAILIWDQYASNKGLALFVLIIVKAFVLASNIITLCYFYNMTISFVNLLQENKREALKFKIIIWLIISIIIISSSSENLIFPVLAFLQTK